MTRRDRKELKVKHRTILKAVELRRARRTRTNPAWAQQNRTDGELQSQTQALVRVCQAFNRRSPYRWGMRCMLHTLAKQR